MHKNIKILFMSVVALLLLAACGKDSNMSAQKLLSKALAEEEKVAYYGEVAMSTNMEDMEDIHMKEWRDHDQIRIEVREGDTKAIAVNDGETLMMLDEETNEVMKFTSGELQDGMMNPKEQLNMLLDSIEDSHELQKVGNERVIGRDTIHLEAKAKEEGGLFGDQEFWIDAEHFIVLKAKMSMDAYDTLLEYTEIEFDPSFEADTFVLEIPENAEVKEIDDDLFEKEITLEEATTILGQAFVALQAENGYEIDSVTLFDVEEIDTKTVNIEYTKDGAASFTLSITSPAEDNMQEQMDIFGKDAKAMTVRGEEAIYLDLEMIHSLIWNEGTFQYSLDAMDPTLTAEALTDIAEELKEVK